MLIPARTLAVFAGAPDAPRHVSSGDVFMILLHQLFKAESLLALFATIALGDFVGKLRVGSFVRPAKVCKDAIRIKFSL